MNERKVVFIANQHQENLGVGYLSSMLKLKGFCVETADFALPKDEVYLQVKKTDPILVGFSLIFQYHSFRLRKLARYLKKNGIDCHFTVGGHYPSLRFEDILNIVPDVDSVVRFEGEHTICELAENLSMGKDWRQTKGIAYRNEGKIISNQLRPLVDDLDSLPFPLRRKRYRCMGKNYVHLIASRGCVRNCSFCSIRKFYSTPPGRLRRTRSPANVVQEMKELYTKSEASVFLFQDDDFVSLGTVAREWILNFIHRLEGEGLADKILWKISCRSDEVDLDLFKKMKEAGLFLVYLGIESGNQKGLDVLNKQLSTEDHTRAVKILKSLNIIYEYGFMLSDPSSTFESIRTNIHFLKEICGNGSSPVVFCKMIPYAETDIEKRLAIEGRLKGSIINPDYNFLNNRLNDYCEFLHRALHEWMFTRKGFLAQLRLHRFEVAILKKFYPQAKGVPQYEDFLREKIALSNGLFFTFAEKTAAIFEENGYDSEKQLNELIAFQNSELWKIKSNLCEGMREFYSQQQ
ncbi:MAG: B12-binding domain-containing radical SAM protein [Promethearchaeota archaeon]